jgi:hypothetical protein
MLRKICLSLLMMLAAGSANAALLVKYDFASNGNPASVYNPATADPLITASAFNPNSGGTVSSGVYTAGGNLGTSSANNKGDFSLRANDDQSQLLIDRVVFKFAPSANLNANRNMVVTLALPDGSEFTGVTSNGGLSTTFVVQDSTDLGLLFGSFNDAGSLAFSFSAKLNGSQSGVLVKLDDIEIYGSVVPEPTSIAIFSSLGLVAVARRIRKKNA